MIVKDINKKDLIIKFSKNKNLNLKILEKICMIYMLNCLMELVTGLAKLSMNDNAIERFVQRNQLGKETSF
jgi:hypothetical protein